MRFEEEAGVGGCNRLRFEKRPEWAGCNRLRFEEEVGGRGAIDCALKRRLRADGKCDRYARRLALRVIADRVGSER